MPVVRGDSANPNQPAVLGKSTAQDQGMGVMGEAARGSGIIGKSTDWIGVYGESTNFQGVHGESKNKDHAGVVGINNAGGAALYGEGSVGLQAIGKKWVGVYGETRAPADVGAAGVWGDGLQGGDGVRGVSTALNKAGVAGFHLSGVGPGVYAEGSLVGLIAKGSHAAGRFIGPVDIEGRLEVRDILVDGDLILNNAGVHSNIRGLIDFIVALERRVTDLENRLRNAHIP
jgi:hypothetical protein